MVVLIDTNVVLDVFLRRAPYEKDAAKIIALSEKNKLQGYISASAVTDIHYIAGKELRSKDAASALIKKLLQTIRVAAVGGKEIYEALELQWDDFEDCVQYVSGKNISAEYIITRNAGDFSSGTLRALSPENFLEMLG